MKYKVIHNKDAMGIAESILMEEGIPYSKKHVLSLLRARNSNNVGLKYFPSAKGKKARYEHYHIVSVEEGDFRRRLLKAMKDNPYEDKRAIGVDDSNLIMPEGG